MSTILVVDDNKINLKVLVAHLMRMGHFVIAAESGFEAIALFKENELDLIFMDYQMPEMDGKEAVTRIREIEKTRKTKYRTPIISVSANLNDKLKELLKEAGVDDFIPKPITKAALERIIQSKTQND